MKKIISLFQRNYETDRKVRDEVVPGAEWVLAGEGVATRKWDGTCCMVRGGKLYKRYDAKHGKTPPVGFEPAQDYDEVTGHMPGWLEVGNGNEDKWHREACGKMGDPDHVNLPDGTYELCGPKIGNKKGLTNREGFERHALVPHGQHVLPDAPRTYAELAAWLPAQGIEGIVWWHPDGRMVKIKADDFPKEATP